MTPPQMIRHTFLLCGLAAFFPAACAIQGPGDAKFDRPADTPPAEAPPSTPPGDKADDPAEPTCPHEGPAIIDPAGLPACPQCGGGRCVPEAALPPDAADLASKLGTCPTPGTLCVPDVFVETMGNFIPTTCQSVAGAEGRCLSMCLPDVAEKAELLPQGVCAGTERCVPCFDPVTQEATGACDIACDPGPIEEAQPLAECCQGLGHCVPTAAVPGDKIDNLLGEECPQDSGAMVCAPDIFIDDPNYKPAACNTKILSIIFGDEFKPGVCLPECMKGTEDSLFIHNDGCQPNFNCVPCISPLTKEPTGACDL